MISLNVVTIHDCCAIKKEGYNLQNPWQKSQVQGHDDKGIFLTQKKPPVTDNDYVLYAKQGITETRITTRKRTTNDNGFWYFTKRNRKSQAASSKP